MPNIVTAVLISMLHLNNFSCFNKKMENNPEQLAAVRHIVAGTSRPAPYLIYGPPGTGKTFTLVEAIKQVCHMVIDKHTSSFSGRSCVK